jgi:hypothetical protein
MSDQNSLNIIEVSEDRAGEDVVVRSTQDTITAPNKVEAYVDDDGVVRQQGNGACFNDDVYEVVE